MTSTHDKFKQISKLLSDNATLINADDLSEININMLSILNDLSNQKQEVVSLRRELLIAHGVIEAASTSTRNIHTLLSRNLEAAARHLANVLEIKGY